MTLLAAIRRSNVRRRLAGAGLPVVTLATAIAKGAMYGLETTVGLKPIQPSHFYMAGIAFLAGRDVVRRLANGNGAVVATRTRTNHLRVINAPTRDAPIQAFADMTELALVSRPDMPGRFPRCKGIVMAFNAALVDAIVRELARQPRSAGTMTGVAFFSGRNVILGLARCHHAVMARTARLRDGGVIHAR